MHSSTLGDIQEVRSLQSHTFRVQLFVLQQKQNWHLITTKGNSQGVGWAALGLPHWLHLATMGPSNPHFCVMCNLMHTPTHLLRIQCQIVTQGHFQLSYILPFSFLCMGAAHLPALAPSQGWQRPGRKEMGRLFLLALSSSPISITLCYGTNENAFMSFRQYRLHKKTTQLKFLLLICI